MSQTKTLNGMQLIFEVKSRINHVLSDFVMKPMMLGILLHSFDAEEKSTFCKRQKKAKKKNKQNKTKQTNNNVLWMGALHPKMFSN